MIENLKNWWKAEKYNILLTIFAALIPLMISWGIGWAQSAINDADTHIIKRGVETERFWWAMGEKANYAVQTVFIGITLFVLIRTRHATTKELDNSKGQIMLYILKNCSLKDYNNESREKTYSNVKDMVRYFYIAWLVVWFLWLAYYLGNYFLAYQENDEVMINIESGAYCGFPTGDIDDLFDATLIDAGQDRFEKMVSGGYQGGLMSFILGKAVEENLLYADFFDRLDTVRKTKPISAKISVNTHMA